MLRRTWCCGRVWHDANISGAGGVIVLEIDSERRDLEPSAGQYYVCQLGAGEYS